MKLASFVKQLFKKAAPMFWSLIKDVWTRVIRPFLKGEIEMRVKRVIESDWNWSTFFTESERLWLKKTAAEIWNTTPDIKPATEIGDAA